MSESLFPVGQWSGTLAVAHTPWHHFLSLVSLTDSSSLCIVEDDLTALVQDKHSRVTTPLICCPMSSMAVNG